MTVALSDMACRVCGGGFSSAFGGSSTYGRCADCGAVNKLITEADFYALHPTYDPGELIAGDIATKVKCLRSVLPESPGSLLDIGCGAGGYLLAAQKLGWQATGVEPSESHSKNGRAAGLAIKTGYFRAGDYAEQFDAVILSHVIEHQYRPEAFLTDIARVLKPGGRLILITPNASALTALATGARWSMLAPIDHVTMIGPRALKHIAPWAKSIRWKTSEYPWEAAATLAVAIRGSKPSKAKSSPERPPVRRPWLRAILTAASLPLWLLGGVTRRQGCLLAVIRA